MNLYVIKFLFFVGNNWFFIFFENFMFGELVLSSSNEDPAIYVWDIRSGAILGSFKSTVNSKNGLALIPEMASGFSNQGFIIANQSEKGMLISYDWQKVNDYITF
jgi:pre-rRNA-processing protein IPI3